MNVGVAINVKPPPPDALPLLATLFFLVKEKLPLIDSELNLATENVSKHPLSFSILLHHTGDTDFVSD